MTVYVLMVNIVKSGELIGTLVHGVYASQELVDKAQGKLSEKDLRGSWVDEHEVETEPPKCIHSWVDDIWFPGSFICSLCGDIDCYYR